MFGLRLWVCILCLLIRIISMTIRNRPLFIGIKSPLRRQGRTQWRLGLLPLKQKDLMATLSCSIGLIRPHMSQNFRYPSLQPQDNFRWPMLQVFLTLDSLFLSLMVTNVLARPAILKLSEYARNVCLTAQHATFLQSVRHVWQVLHCPQTRMHAHVLTLWWLIFATILPIRPWRDA